MQIRTYVSHSDVSDAFRTHIERRLRFALGRFGDRVGVIAVRFKSKGPAGHRCHMSAQLSGFGRVIINESDFDLFVAIDRAAGKLGEQFGRTLERMRDAKVSRQSIRLAA